MDISAAISEQYDFWRTAALNITKDVNAADELLHDTIDRAMTSPAFKSVCDRNEHKYYLLTAMKISYRSGTYFKTYRTELIELPIDIADKSDETWLGARLANEQIDVLFNRLPEFERDLIEIHILNGWSLQRTSEITGIPKKFVKRNIIYSIKKIRNVVCK